MQRNPKSGVPSVYIVDRQRETVYAQSRPNSGQRSDPDPDLNNPKRGSFNDE